MLIVTAPEGASGCVGGQPQPSRAKGVLKLDSSEIGGGTSGTSDGNIGGLGHHWISIFAAV
jgi:hypothetical protein